MENQNATSLQIAKSLAELKASKNCNKPFSRCYYKGRLLLGWKPKETKIILSKIK